MSFQPDEHLVIGEVQYLVAAHPAVPGYAYGQEGRQGTVYQLLDGQGARRKALKVFKGWHRRPALVALGERVAGFAAMPGLSVCARTVLTPQRESALLRDQPDLIYAVLMPWVAGPTWMEVMLERRVLAPEASLRFARSLAEILSRMEQGGLAHCDLSGQNLLLPGLGDAPLAEGAPGVELVDVEQMYGPGLEQPEALPGGSWGYAHRSCGDGFWNALGDRFAGAILLAEILGWCDAGVRNSAWGESYFDLDELPSTTGTGSVAAAPVRYDALTAALCDRWGRQVSALFERAWQSERLAECATFGEWLMALPATVSQPQSINSGMVGTARPQAPPVIPPAESIAASHGIRRLLDSAWHLEDAGDLVGALAVYRNACELCEPGTGIGAEIRLMAAELEQRLAEGKELRQAIVRRHGNLPVIEQETLRRLTQVAILRGRLKHPVCAVISADGQMAVVGAGDAHVAIWEAPGTAQERMLAGHTDGILSVAWSPDGARLASGSRDGSLRLWSRAGESCLCTLKGHVHWVTSVAFSPDGRLVASGSRDGTVRLWDASPGDCIRTYEAHAGGVTSVAFSPDGTLLVSGGHDGVRLWRTGRGGAPRPLRGQALTVGTAAFAPEGDLLAAAGGDGIIRLWNLADGSVRQLPGHTAQVNSLAFSPDGLLASGSADRSIRFWRPDDGACLRVLREHLNPVESVCFGPDGTAFLSAGYEGVRVWGVR